MKPYLKQQPQILTDTIFNLYGGSLDNSAPGQRRAAYVIAEVAAEMDIGTYLLPTVYTGTYMWASEINLDHTYINQIIQTNFVDFSGDIYHTINGINNWYQAMRDWEYGILNLSLLHSYCCSGWSLPWQVQVIYNAGLSSGTTYTPNVLMALSTYSQIVLNEMIGYGNEAPGDIGVTQFDNMDYAESRVAMIQTAFGTSAKAQFAHKMLSGLRRYKIAGMSVPYR